MKLTFGAIILFVALSSATTYADLFNYSTEEYLKMCIGSMYNGQWDVASMSCGSGASKAEKKGEDPRLLALFRRSQAQSMGVYCHYKTANSLLEKSLELDKNNDGPIFHDYLELARLHFVQKLYPEADHYYNLALSAIPEDFISKYPIDNAEILNEYSIVLKEIGHLTDSEKLATLSKEYRSYTQNSASITKRTPYGTLCDQK